MSTFTPSPEFDYYYKACRKGDREAKAVAVSYSPSGSWPMRAKSPAYLGIISRCMKSRRRSSRDCILNRRLTVFWGFASAESKAETDPLRLSRDHDNRLDPAGHP